MIVLGLDTTGGHCSAAVLDAGHIRAECSENIGRGHAERLAPMVQDLLTAAQLKPQDIERLGVCTGPGSFTGSRVALSFAKGFALPRQLPVIGISALEALAAQSQASRILSVMDVRRGDVCWALYETGNALQVPVTQPLEIAQRHIKSHTYEDIVGDGAHMITGEPVTHTIVSGAVIARLAQKYSPDTHPGTPLYSRAADAKLPGGISPS